VSRETMKNARGIFRNAFDAGFLTQVVTPNILLPLFAERSQHRLLKRILVAYMLNIRNGTATPLEILEAVMDDTPESVRFHNLITTIIPAYDYSLITTILESTQQFAQGQTREREMFRAYCRRVDSLYY
jgi:hypothetical protein